jgi:uncharacterized protein (DUF1800 family)
MTLIWHEHFATSNEKVGVGLLMEKHEILLRKYALRRFPDMLKGITKDQAMLIWLDNDGNYAANCRDSDAALPNANYARELLQLFSTGPVQLNMDGTPVTDVNGVPLPAYTEQDVKEVALALSGWRVDWHRERFRAAFFDPEWHCTREKTVLGVTIPEREGKLGAKDVDDVVAIIMQQPSTAPFISKTLIQKLATEAPTPGYVQRVATVFAASRGDIRLTVRAILLDPEFTSEAVVRSQYKEPIEQLVGPIRALGGSTGGDALIQWSYLARQLIYYPPSVFSFYPPGHKDALVNTALLNFRDRAADEFATSWWDTGFDADKLLRTKKLTTPELAADYLASTLLAAPATPELRSELIAYMNTDEGLSGRKFRGAVWLVLCSPDFQRN